MTIISKPFRVGSPPFTVTIADAKGITATFITDDLMAIVDTEDGEEIVHPDGAEYFIKTASRVTSYRFMCITKNITVRASGKTS